MKIYLASDHAGLKLKNNVKSFLLKEGYDVEDCGVLSFNKDDDYPNLIAKAAQRVSKNPQSFGIVFGKSGVGECIVANKIKGIRAVLGFSKQNVELSRLDNNTNILSLGSAFLNLDQSLDLIKVFLNTSFSNEERHRRRLNEISKLEVQ